MANTLVILCCLAVASAIAKPATNDQLDKVTVNDVAANAVSPDKKAEENEEEKKDGATVQITGITTGVETPDQIPTLFHPQRAGSMFARFIDDIFQIPINVLQNVAKLITSPFTQSKKTPEASATS
ncbi:hypothetical protein Zmor_006798 [Zophobas morio]|uniref:Uncharacterized protein n=1 Tax=Zophobas morio TaxID=2755281 RepID=A0AA38IWV4_9CUCU|nr:hypothetical protein Zmor_006798 [Zophobas morio]